MPEENKKIDDQPDQKVKGSKNIGSIPDWIAILISVVSLCLAMWSFFSAKQNEEDILKLSVIQMSDIAKSYKVLSSIDTDLSFHLRKCDSVNSFITSVLKKGNDLVSVIDLLGDGESLTQQQIDLIEQFSEEVDRSYIFESIAFNIYTTQSFTPSEVSLALGTIKHSIFERIINEANWLSQRKPGLNDFDSLKVEFDKLGCEKMLSFHLDGRADTLNIKDCKLLELKYVIKSTIGRLDRQAKYYTRYSSNIKDFQIEVSDLKEENSFYKEFIKSF